MEAAQAYLNARLSIFAGRLLGRERLDASIEEPATEIHHPEAEAGLERLLSDVRGPSIWVEQLLLMKLLRDFQVLTRPLGPAERGLLTYSLHWFELANLKTILRAKLSGLSELTYRDELVDLGNFARLPVEQLNRAEDPAELLRLLEATPFADIARHARRSFEHDSDLFSVDAAIDRRFLAGLKRRAMSVNLDERFAVLKIVGCLLDRYNLMWLLRFRLSYGLSPAETYYLLIPSPHTLNAERLQKLVPEESLGAVLEALPQRMKVWVHDAQSISEVEDRLDRMGQVLPRACLRDTRFPTARAFAYLLTREREMRQIVAIAKGKRLKFPPELIRAAARTEAT